MSLEHAILGFLQYRPLTGYDLKKVFDISVRHFWPADQSQIYKTLARLEKKSWARREVLAQESRPPRKLFHITEEGRRELARWLASPVTGEEGRSASLIQVFFAGNLTDSQALKLFEDEAERFRSLLAHYGQVPEQVVSFRGLATSPRDTFFWMLTLECGRHMARAHLEWLESVIRRLENREYVLAPEVEIPPAGGNTP
jgi:PadR family transcriptional regulator AphA